MYDYLTETSNSWFNQQNNSITMSVTSSPVRPGQYQVWDEAELARVSVVTVTPNNVLGTQLPKSAELVINYYQVNRTQKKVLSAFLYLNEYTDRASTDSSYKFTLTLRPMSHSSVLVVFGFEWYVYMVMLLIVGVAITLEVLIYALYHCLTNRKEDRPGIKFRLYLGTFVTNITIGIFLAMVPTSLAMLILKLLSTGNLVSTPIVRFLCTGAEDATCFRSIFDLLDSNFSQVTRDGRTGTGLLVVGFYFMYQTSEYFVCYTQHTELARDVEFLGNHFSPRRWGKGEFFFLIIVNLYEIFVIVYFSYSQVFALNSWVFFVVMKLVAMTIEEIHEGYLDDSLPKSALKIVTDIAIYVATLSSPTFLVYLFSFVIDLGVELFMRSYMYFIWEWLVDLIKDYYQAIDSFITKLIGRDDEAEGAQEVESQEEQKANDKELKEEIRPLLLEMD